jgi:hypothetical protein
MKLTPALLLTVVACFDMGPPQETIVGKEPYPDPESLRPRWEAIEQCSGLHGDFDRVIFSTATRIYDKDGEHGGVWLAETNEIVVSVRAIEDLTHNLAIEHESMHALLHRGGHPSYYFNGVCGDLMNMWEVQ